MIIVIDLKWRFFQITKQFYIIEMQSINYNIIMTTNSELASSV